MEKKLVLPGDHLSSAEEAEAGRNTYSENDEIYSAAIGRDASEPGKAEIATKGGLQRPYVGMPVYCLIVKASLNKAVASCISIEEADGGVRSVQMDAVLPVTAIRRGYVRDIRDEVKIGDIIRARIQKIEKTGFDITLKDNDCGAMAVFCPRDRSRMALSERIFICPSCGWKERRKLPLKEGETPPPEEEYRPRRDFRHGRPPRPGGERGFRRGFRRRGESSF